jgi:hypothetical protein
MIDHLLSRIFTVADVGRWHGRTNYPSETDGVRMPLWRQAPPLPPEAAAAVVAPEAVATPAVARPASSARGGQAGGG